MTQEKIIEKLIRNIKLAEAHLQEATRINSGILAELENLCSPIKRKTKSKINEQQIAHILAKRQMVIMRNAERAKANS